MVLVSDSASVLKCGCVTYVALNGVSAGRQTDRQTYLKCSAC